MSDVILDGLLKREHNLTHLLKNIKARRKALEEDIKCNIELHGEIYGNREEVREEIAKYRNAKKDNEIIDKDFGVSSVHTRRV